MVAGRHNICHSFMAALALPAALLLGACDQVPEFGGSEAPTEASTESAPATAGSDLTAPTFNYARVADTLSTLSVDIRNQVLDDEALFSRVVEAERDAVALLRAAFDNGMANADSAKVLMRRASEKVLAEAYLLQLLRVNFPAGYPSDEQMVAWFEQNRERFETPQRVHIWQVFWAKPEDEDVTDLISTAGGVAKQIKTGAISFDAAAGEFSDHLPSRAGGGYMGLLNVTDLIPEVRSVVLSLKEDALSDPVVSDAGVHLIKRGEIVPARQFELTEVQAEVRKAMLDLAQAELRAAIVKKARQEYADNVLDEEFMNWLDEARATNWGDGAVSAARSTDPNNWSGSAGSGTN